MSLSIPQTTTTCARDGRVELIYSNRSAMSYEDL